MNSEVTLLQYVYCRNASVSTEIAKTRPTLLVRVLNVRDRLIEEPDNWQLIECNNQKFLWQNKKESRAQFLTLVRIFSLMILFLLSFEYFTNVLSFSRFVLSFILLWAVNLLL